MVNGNACYNYIYTSSVQLILKSTMFGMQVTQAGAGALSIVPNGPLQSVTVLSAPEDDLVALACTSSSVSFCSNCHTTYIPNNLHCFLSCGTVHSDTNTTIVRHSSCHIFQPRKAQSLRGGRDPWWVLVGFKHAFLNESCTALQSHSLPTLQAMTCCSSCAEYWAQLSACVTHVAV